MNYGTQHPYDFHSLVSSKIPQSCQIVVDAGCGRGVWGFLIRTSRHVEYLVGIDISLEYLHSTKKHNIYDDVILASVEKMPFKEKSVNILLAVEVIEHLHKAAAISMLSEIERVTVKRVLLTTPNGFLPSLSPSSTFEVHRSGWSPNQLKSFGYNVFGMGLKAHRDHPSKLTYVLRCVLSPFVWFIPTLAASILAVKENYVPKNLNKKHTK